MGFARLSGLSLCLALGACVGMPSGTTTPTTEDAPLAKGPPIRDIVTEFDEALSCMDGALPDSVTFAVGQIADNTGKEQYADGGTGKLVTQGAGDIVQSALFRAGLTVVNRRDPNIILAENNWGIRNVKLQRPADLYISGSITSLDYIPGGGAQLEIAGVGPRYRQTRILIGLDLALTAAHSGEVVANVPLQKQIYAEEMGFSSGRFFGETLVSLDAGGMEREALHFALRQMLSYATYDLLAQIAPEGKANACGAKISTFDAVKSGTAGQRSAVIAEVETAAKEAAKQPAQMPQGAAPGGAPRPQAAVAPAPGTPAKPMSDEARKLANSATSYAARAIASADAVVAAKTGPEAEAAASEAVRYMTLAIQALRAGAAAGLSGPEGDAAATVVEQAVAATEAAQKLAAEKAGKAPGAEATPAPDGAAPQTPAASPAAPVNPATGDSKVLGGAAP